eukprot:2302520-Pleurochrysis_carterae.AAC.1
MEALQGIEQNDKTKQFVATYKEPTWRLAAIARLMLPYSILLLITFQRLSALDTTMAVPGWLQLALGQASDINESAGACFVFTEAFFHICEHLR